MVMAYSLFYTGHCEVFDELNRRNCIKGHVLQRRTSATECRNVLGLAIRRLDVDAAH